MKKAILYSIILFLGINVSAQNIITFGDTNNGYLLPYTHQNLNPMYLVAAHSPTGTATPAYFRRGNSFPVQPLGTKIYGIAALLFESIVTDSGYYAFLVSDDKSCTVIDSLRIDTVTPTTYLHIINPLVNDLYPKADTMIPVHEVFFDRGYSIDNSRCVVVLGNKNYPTQEEIDNYHYFPVFTRDYAINPSDSIRNFDYWVRGESRCVEYEYNYQWFAGAIPIIDSTLRIRHEQASTCGDIGRLRADYTGVRIHKLHWSDTNGHCLYQVAYGRANQPFSSYNVIETTDTSYIVAGLSYGEPYAFRVRAKCCFNDTMSVWQPWSDTVQFSRPYYTVTLLANNDAWGTVGGGGRHERNDTVTIGAYPAGNCTFEGWNDGDTSNPRTITLVCDTTFTAVFEYHQDSTSVLTVDNIANIVIAPNPTDGTVRITASVPLLSVDVYDLQGRAVVRSKATGTDIELDLGVLPPAVYTAAIHTERGTAIGKIVKQ